MTQTDGAAAGGGRWDEPTTPELVARFAELGTRLSAATVAFNARVAQQAGLSTTDHKCLELAKAAESRLTAGQIAELSGLSTGAVTGVIDRLERAGFVRRVRDPQDRRKVLVEVSERRLSEHPEVFGGLAAVMARVLAHFDADQRAIIERYSTELIDALTGR